MRQSVKITIQDEKTKRVLSSYSSGYEIESTTTCSELKKQIRESINVPGEEVSQILWSNNKEVQDEKTIPNNTKLDYVLLIQRKESETPIFNPFG